MSEKRSPIETHSSNYIRELEARVVEGEARLKEEVEKKEKKLKFLSRI